MIEGTLHHTGEGASALPPLDPDRIAMVAETDEELAALMALFFRIANDCVAALEAGGPESAKAAHNLKGSAANLGMLSLATICQQFEKISDKSPSERTELLTRIKDELNHIRHYVQGTYPCCSHIGG